MRPHIKDQYPPSVAWRRFDALLRPDAQKRATNSENIVPGRFRRL